MKSSNSESMEVMEDERDAGAERARTHSKDESAVSVTLPSDESPHDSTTASPLTDSPILVNADVWRHTHTHSLH